ncbi:hypothetical protein ACHAQA_008664 [Verticillium albo-atrum]
MLLKAFVGLAFAASVTASPFADVSAQPVSRATQDPCDGGRVFVGWFDKSKGIIPQCKCLKSQVWNDEKHKCISPPLVAPVVGAGQKVICATDPHSFRDYDTNDDLCLNNGQNVVLAVLRSLDGPQLEQQIREKCKKKPKCPAGQTWSEEHKKCKHPSLPKDDAQKCRRKGGKPVCAKTPTDYCDYGGFVGTTLARLMLTAFLQTRTETSAKTGEKIVFNVLTSALGTPLVRYWIGSLRRSGTL